MSDVKFVRIRGRIVPIRKKQDDAKGVAMIATGAATSIASGLYAGKQIQKANFAFARSANLRGAAKLVFSKKSPNYGGLIKQSAAFKMAGRSLTRKSSAALFIGTSIGGVLASVGANRIFNDKNRDKKSLKVESIGLAVGALGLLPFGKMGKISGLVRSSIKSKSAVKDIFSAWSKSGAAKSSSTVNKYAMSAYKGVKPKPKNIYDAKQLDMIPMEKKFNIKKWFK